MKFHIFTLGCKVNQYESQAMLERLENSGRMCYDDNSENLNAAGSSL